MIRTHLANERTLLAYIRTSLAFMAGGLGMIHFFPAPFLHLFGWILLGIGVVVLGVGVIRFLIVMRRISKINI